MFFHQFVDGMLQTSGHELVFQGDGKHHHLIIVAGFEFCHGKYLYLINPFSLR
jgi:hypothetical protein